MKIWMFVIVVITLTMVQVNAEVFDYKAGNISFDIDSLKYNNNNSQKEPLSLVFQTGEPSFSVSILFKIESEN